MRCSIKLYRPYNRKPGDHEYGQQFDEAIDRLVGSGVDWRKQGSVNPVATIANPEIDIELHETGPLFLFFVDHASEVATYIGALATLISTWITVRLQYREKRAEVWEPDGTIIEVGDLKITAGRDLSPDEMQSLCKFLLQHAKDTKKPRGKPRKK